MKNRVLRPFAVVIALLCLAVVGGCGDITSDIGISATATVPAVPRVVPTPSPKQSIKLMLPDLTAAGLKEIVLSEEEARSVVSGKPLAAKFYASSEDVTKTTTIVENALKKAGFSNPSLIVHSSFFAASCFQRSNLPELYYQLFDYRSIANQFYNPTATPSLNTPTFNEKVEKQMRGYRIEILLAFLSTKDCQMEEPPTVLPYKGYTTAASLPYPPYPVTIIRTTPATAHP